MSLTFSSRNIPILLGELLLKWRFLVFFIGLLCVYNEVTLAVILSVTITVILYTRSILHHFAQKISKEEMADTLKFVVIAFVVLLLLPNQGYSPYEIFNPYLVWLMVVLVSGKFCRLHCLEMVRR